MIIYEEGSCRYFDSTEKEIYKVIDSFYGRETKICANEFMGYFKLDGYNLSDIYFYYYYGWKNYEDMVRSIRIRYDFPCQCILELHVQRII